MKSGVTNVTLKLSEPEAVDSPGKILDDPTALHGMKIEDDGKGELELDGIKYTIINYEGRGKIGPWTDSALFTFEMRTDTNGADGLGWALLNSTDFPTDIDSIPIF